MSCYYVYRDNDVSVSPTSICTSLYEAVEEFNLFLQYPLAYPACARINVVFDLLNVDIDNRSDSE